MKDQFLILIDFIVGIFSVFSLGILLGHYSEKGFVMGLGMVLCLVAAALSIWAFILMYRGY